MLSAVSRQAILLLSVILAAVWVPLGLDTILDLRVVRTIILHSPVNHEFLFIEYVPDWLRDALSAEETALMEHGMIHRTENRTAISRETFENALPFIYAEGMRLRGLLPVTIDNQEFDVEALRQGKTILGITPADLTMSRLGPAVHALLDSRPDKVALTFPEDRFRLRGGLEFVNADTNAPDAALSERFNHELTQAGFVFPATAAFGRDMILKPWDAGWFVLDVRGNLFNLRRLRDHPEARRVDLPADCRVAHVQVQESKDKRVAALLIDEKNNVHLLGSDLTTRPLHCPGYDPRRHNLKVVLDPIGETCVFDDRVQATALYRPAGHDGPVSRLELAVPSASPGPGAMLSWFLAPVRLTPIPEDTVFVAPRVSTGGAWSLAGALAWGLAAAIGTRRHGLRHTAAALVWGGLGGAAGALAVWLWPGTTA